jgi:hypothetical protein
MRLTRFLALALGVLVPGALSAQETIDNPEFTNWSKFKKGTSVTLKSSSSVAGMANEFTLTSTLLEVGSDKLVVETSTVIKAAGMEIKSPAMKRDITKTITLPKGVKKEALAGGKPEGTVEEGTETLKISGMEIKTKWYKAKSEVAGIKTESKVWMSEDIPGRMVKMEATTSGAAATTTKMELVEFKKP